jgi:hypothetical protein
MAIGAEICADDVDNLITSKSSNLKVINIFDVRIQFQGG